MKIKPIIFSGSMVKAILDGDKTMTRRVIKPQPDKIELRLLEYAPYKPSDILWVRETWTKRNGHYLYLTEDIPGNRSPDDGEMIKWRPSIYMPREAARIFLRVEKVSVERLQEISVEDIAREALAGLIPDSNFTFRSFWDSLHKSADIGKYGWDANPWVWVISFERCEKPTKQ